MECSSEVRSNEIKRICKLINQNYDYSVHVGVLLCEGDENSIDVKLYSKVYPNLLVIPVGGWSDVDKLVKSIRKRNEDKSVFGLIDRDANSKKEIRQYRKDKGIYCTKLPFIENVICSPEVIKIFCRYLNLDYKYTIKLIDEMALQALTHKFREALPVNISISMDDLIESVHISIKTKDGIVLEKMVNEPNILYSYKDKTIANIVAEALGLKGRPSYYEFFADMLEENLVKYDLITVTRAYLPQVEI